MSAVRIVLAALVATFSGLAFAAPPGPAFVNGQVCVLDKPLTANRDGLGKGPARNYKAGAEVTIVFIGKIAAKVSSGGAEGLVSLKALGKVCKPKSATAATAVAKPAAGTDKPTAGAAKPALIPDEPELAPPSDAGAATTAAAAPAASTQPTLAKTPAASEPAARPARRAATSDSGKLKVAVMELTMPADVRRELAATVNGTVAETLDKLGAFSAISSREVAQMLELEANKQLMGCDTGSCLADIGGALGADYLVTGTLNVSGGTYTVQLQLTNISQSRVDGRASREYSGNEAGLMEEVRIATRALVRNVMVDRSGFLALGVSEEGATVKVDDAVVGVSPLPGPLSMAGGPHALTVEKEGFVRFQQDLMIKPNETVDVTATLMPSAEFARAARSKAGFWRLLSWTAIGVGVVGIGGGGGLYFKARGDASSLNTRIDAYNAAAVRTQTQANDLTSTRKQIARYDAGALTAAGVGVGFIAAGVMLRMFGDDPDRYGDGSVAGPVVTPVLGSTWGLAVRF